MEEKIFINTAIQLFNEKSIYFTLEQLAKKLKMSKRTIYEIYGNKEKIIETLVMSLIQSIRDEELKVINNEALDIVAKLKRVLCMYPNYEKVNYAYVNDIKEEYPDIYTKINDSFDAGWEDKFALYKQGIQEGKLKKINFNHFKIIMLGMFKEVLLMNDINQEEAVKDSVDIIFNGCMTSNN